MMRKREQYNICENLLNIPANITIGQLLNISKISKDELIKGIKNSKQNNENIINAANSTIDNNYNNNDNSSNNENYSDINYNSKIANNLNNNNNIVHEHDVAVVRGYINGYPASIFIDACSNANLISRKFLNKFVKNYQIIGHDKSTIRQAMVDDISRVYDIVRLAVKLGSVEFITDFKISDKDDPFYDVIISLKTQSDNRILINTIHKVLAYMNMDDKLVPISNIEDINTFRSQSLLCVSPEPKIDIVEATLFVDANEPNSNISAKEKDDVINSIINQLKFKNKKDYKKFCRLLKKFDDIIAISSDDLEPSKLFPHHIILEENSMPIKQKAYKISQVQSNALKEELRKLLEKKLIEPSHSPWASPVVLVLKKNGKWRLCVDFRKLNDITIKDAYALPKIREIFDALKDAKIFSSIDLFSGYHQIPMWAEDMEKTSFTTKFGYYYFKVMPFGLTNTPATFQREMNRIFFDLINDCVQIYLDDIIIYSDSFEKHLIYLSKVFNILRKYNLKLNIEKCHFCQTEIEALGHKVTTDGLLPLDKKTLSIMNMCKEFRRNRLQITKYTKYI